ncbi:MAG: hypothetical protein ABFD52_00695 [Acidobacteriota bacterium]
MALKTFFSTANLDRLQAIHDRIKTLDDPVLLDAVERLHSDFKQKYAVHGEPHWKDIPMTEQPVVWPELGPYSVRVGRRKKKAK